MLADQLLEIQDVLRRHGLLISFSGRLSQGIIEELGEAVKKHLESEERPKNDIFNIFSIFIEQTQNIKNYCTRKEGTSSYEHISNSCIVTIGRTEQGNYICSGNLIESQDTAALIERMHTLVSLDKDQLKKLYKEQMRREVAEIGEWEGAGLGLIDIARKASLPLEYSLKELDEKYAFFTLKAVV